MSMRTRLILVAAAMNILYSGAGPPVAAEGAVALGIPGDIAEHGVAAGYAIGKASADEAKKVALEECRSAPAPEDTRALCRVYETFNKRCFAFALDPQDSTPGWGWHVADNLEDARKIALDRCTRTEGPDRKGQCKVAESGCDGE